MSWIILFLAGIFEVAWAVGLKFTEGFTKGWATLGTLVAVALSMLLLGLALRDLPVGTAYAIWVGIGVVGTAAAGVILFSEPVSAFRVLSLALIVIGIVGLKLTSTPTQ
ncbi:DMT family transporter [Pirellulaceae bacterium SH449]